MVSAVRWTAVCEPTEPGGETRRHEVTDEVEKKGKNNARRIKTESL